MSSAAPDPLRRLAQERGRILGELGARPEDVAWARAEAEVVASLTTPAMRPRLAAPLRRLLSKLARLAR